MGDQFSQPSFSDLLWSIGLRSSNPFRTVFQSFSRHIFRCFRLNDLFQKIPWTIVGYLHANNLPLYFVLAWSQARISKCDPLAVHIRLQLFLYDSNNSCRYRLVLLCFRLHEILRVFQQSHGRSYCFNLYIRTSVLRAISGYNQNGLEKNEGLRRHVDKRYRFHDGLIHDT